MCFIFPRNTNAVAADSGNKTRLLIRRVPELLEAKKFAVSVEP